MSTSPSPIDISQARAQRVSLTDDTFVVELDPSRVLWKLVSRRTQPAERLTTLRPYATFCRSFAKNEGSCL